MFNLKKKESQATIVAKIHEEFDTAVDVLLSQAKETLGNPVDLSKSERLKKIGFNGCAEVKKMSELGREINNSKEILERVGYYSQHYPNNKFITPGMVEKICKKYRLVLGRVGRYIGDVPEKNIEEIEKFKLREEDKTVYKVHQVYDGRSTSGHRGYVRNDSIYIEDSFSNNFRGSDVVYIYDDKIKTVTEQPGFKICAPEKDFDMRQMRVSADGYTLVKDDPIVLQPVKGGYLIVSKWGLEASDKDVINEKHN